MDITHTLARDLMTSVCARGGGPPRKPTWSRSYLRPVYLVQIVSPASLPTSDSVHVIFPLPKFRAVLGGERTYVAPASFTHSVITREGELVHSVITGAA